MSVRPAVSVIVPFAGSREQLRRAIDALEQLELGDEDEVLVALNRPVARIEPRSRPRPDHPGLGHPFARLRP